MRIVFISPYRDLSFLAQSVADELDMAVEFYEGWLDNAGTVIDRLRGKPVDVVMSRGGTAEYLAEHYDIPVVRVNTGPFDMMECIDEARHYSSNIVVTSFGKEVIGLNLLERILDVSITEVVFNSIDELEKRIAALAQDGNYCIVGGGPSVTFARQYGLTGLFAKTSRETLQNAFLQAVDVYEISRKEKLQANRVKTILACTYDGIVAVDGRGRVEICNAAAERIMNIKADEVIGRAVSEVIPNTRLDRILKSGAAEIDQLQEVNGNSIVTSRVPLMDGRDIVGAVASFKELSKVVQVEHRMRKELSSRSKFHTRYCFADIVADSATMKDKVSLAASFAKSDLTVLIFGPTGTGKELFAQSIHQASLRSSHPFVAVNCGALPPALLESELFGYEEGAFTGARRRGKHGLFELAHGGTIFLDEIDSIPLELQGRLLRVLQEREVLRLGGETIIPIDVRVIAATNQQPMYLLEQKKIRTDLFYRLNVLYLEIPPLCERTDDIEALCKQFLAAAEQAALAPLLQDMLPYFKRYSWPGNVRELSNVMQRLAFFAKIYGERYQGEELLRVLAPNILSGSKSKDLDFKGRLRQTEDDLILHTVKTAGSVEAAAEKLGIGKSTLWRKLKRIKQSQP